ncbi:MAG: hypothetical protein LBT62_06960, partial [Deltaproteobacteria bacterium]|nr:hypothetical protein [Deltaproteobacteria bacterium]
HGLKTQTSEFFSNETNAPDFFEANASRIQDAVDTPIGQVGEPLDSADKLVLYTPIEKIESVVPPLDDEQTAELVAEGWKKEMAAKMARDEAAAFLKLASENGWDAQIETLSSDVDHGKTNLFSRLRFYEAGAHLADVAPNDLMDEFFNLGRVGDRVNKPLKVETADNPGYLVLYVHETKVADEAELDPTTLSERKKAARTALSRTGYSYWASSRSMASRIKLPLTLEAYFNSAEQPGL